VGHLTRANYRFLQRRMDRSIPGIFDSDTLYEILKVLFTDEEALLCSQMPLTYFTVQEIAGRWEKSIEQSQQALDVLASKGLVCRKTVNGERKHLLAPPVLGFFEFSLMRTDGKFDRKRLSELYHRYISIEEGFARQYASVDPPVARVFVHEDTITDTESEVLSYEKASVGIDQATCITTGTCFCRHKMEHLGMACENPQEVCLTFNAVAEHLAAEGIARKISKQEAHAILDDCVKRGLVQIGDNKADELIVICNCCGCCCDLLGIYKRFGVTSLISPSRYMATIHPESCSGCLTCAERCPVDSISVVDGAAHVLADTCLGCGVCARFCPTGACRMQTRDNPPFVPQTTFEKVALQAIEQGKIGNFLFDDCSKWKDRFLSRLINVLVSFPPAKRLLLMKSVSSRLFRFLSRRQKFTSTTAAQERQR